MEVEDNISIHARKYVGNGNLKFDSSAPVNCNFEFMFRNDGKSRFEAVLYVTNDNCETILGLLPNGKIHYASFEGTDTKKGQIIIKKLALDGGSIVPNSLPVSNPDKYKIRDDLLRKILSINGAEKFIYSFRNVVFTSRLRFLLMSQATIDYEICQDSEVLSSVSALLNFQFGPSKDYYGSNLPNIEGFSVKIDKTEILFEQKSDYHTVISQSAFNRNPDFTSTATIDSENANSGQTIELLNKICILLSFSNGNWITPLYTDYLKDGELVKTVFYKNKTYRFNNSRYLVDSKTSPYTSIVDFLTKSYKQYDNLVKDFRIHKVIEYYISAHVNSIQQEKFAVGYMALEVLCSAVPSYAEAKGEKIKIKSIEDTFQKLQEVLQELKSELTDDQIKRVTDKVAYKKVTIKDQQRYLINDMSLEVDEDLNKRTL